MGLPFTISSSSYSNSPAVALRSVFIASIDLIILSTAVGSPEKIKPKSTSSGFPIVSIIIGAILLIAGLVGILMRVEITISIVGRSQVVREAFWGGSSTSTALTTVTIISTIAMILGLIFFAIGIVKAKTNQHK